MHQIIYAIAALSLAGLILVLIACFIGLFISCKKQKKIKKELVSVELDLSDAACQKRIIEQNDF